MKKTLLLAGVACLVAGAASASYFNPYVSGKLSYMFLEADGKNTWNGGSNKETLDRNTWGVNIAFGSSYEFTYGGVRAELELNLRDDAELHKGGIKSKLENDSVMANFYYDFTNSTKFTPYVGAGIGMSRLKAKTMGVSKKDNNFTWQVGAGVAYNLCKNWTVDLGYRYTDAGDLTKNYGAGKYKVDVESHEVLLGVRYTF